MGLFNNFTSKSKPAGKVENNNRNTEATIVLAPSSHMVEEEIYGEETAEGEYIIYRMSFQINDSFKEAESHAGEVEMLNTYAPESEYGEEGSYPYVAIQIDDSVYMAVEEFKEKGTFTGAMEITPLSGKFYFKGKMEYYGNIMYFYGMDRCDGVWENNGLCTVYPKAYTGTENERKLMQVLDEAAESYCEEKKV